MNQSRKLLPIEGVRGLAAFVVVLSHLRLTFYLNGINDIRSHIVSWSFFEHHPLISYIAHRPVIALLEGATNGAFAVWLFWVMSAFVLAMQFFVRARESTNTAAHDYLEQALIRRYPRLLLPVLVSVLFAWALCAMGLMQNVALTKTLGTTCAQGWLGEMYTFPASFLGAIKSAVWQCFFCYDQSTSYNVVLWTMEKEFFGSVFLFAFLGLLGHRTSRFIAYPIIALVNTFYGLQWLNAFVAGILLCDLLVNRGEFPLIGRVLRSPLCAFVRRSSWVAVILWAGVIICAGLKDFEHTFGPKYGPLYGPSFEPIFHLLVGCAAVALALASSFSQRVLSSIAPVFLGKISFGLYLIHIPVICSFAPWAYFRVVPLVGAASAACIVSLLTCALSLVMGYLLYLVADRPAIGLSKKLSSLLLGKAKAPPQSQAEKVVR